MNKFRPIIEEALEEVERKGMLKTLRRVIAKQKEKEMTDPKYMRPGLGFARGKAIEELGELQAALGKSLRWGWTSYNPELTPQHRLLNHEWVRAEMQDVRDALDNLDKELKKRGW